MSMIGFIKEKIVRAKRYLELLFMSKQKTRLVDSSDLDTLLKSLNLTSSDAMHCYVCKNATTGSNVFAIIKDKGQIRVICDKTSCVNSLYDSR